MNIVRTSIFAAAVLGSILLAFPTSAGSGSAKGPALEGSWLGTLKVSAIEQALREGATATSPSRSCRA